jgi:hypothetical protein
VRHQEPCGCRVELARVSSREPVELSDGRLIEAGPSRFRNTCEFEALADVLRALVRLHRGFDQDRLACGA